MASLEAPQNIVLAGFYAIKLAAFVTRGRADTPLLRRNYTDVIAVDDKLAIHRVVRLYVTIITVQRKSRNHNAVLHCRMRNTVY